MLVMLLIALLDNPAEWRVAATHSGLLVLDGLGLLPDD